MHLLCCRSSQVKRAFFKLLDVPVHLPSDEGEKGRGGGAQPAVAPPSGPADHSVRSSTSTPSSRPTSALASRPPLPPPPTTHTSSLPPLPPLPAGSVLLSRLRAWALEAALVQGSGWDVSLLDLDVALLPEVFAEHMQDQDRGDSVALPAERGDIALTWPQFFNTVLYLLKR